MSDESGSEKSADPQSTPPTPEDIDVLQSALAGLREERDSLIRRLQAAEAESETTRCRLADLETESEVYNAELERLAAERENDTAQLAALRAQLEQARQASAEREQTSAAAIARVTDLERSVETLMAERDALRADMHQARAQIDQITPRLEDLQRALDEKHTALDAALQGRAGIEHDLAELRNAHAQQLKERDDQLAQNQAAWNSERDDLARRLESEQSETIDLQQQLDAANAGLCSAEAKAHEIGEEVLRLRGEIDVLQGETQRERGVYDAAAQQRETEFQRQRSESQTLLAERETQLGERDAQLAERAAQLADRDTQLADLQDERDQVAARLRQLETTGAQHDALGQTHAHLVARHQELQDAHGRAVQEAERLATQLRTGEDEARALAAARDEERKAFATRQVDAEERVKKLQAALEDIRQSQTQLTAANADLERQRSELRAQVETLAAEVRQRSGAQEDLRVAAAQTQQGLTARVDELVAERQSAGLRLTELETLANQLERECERLRRERSAPEEVRRFKAEITRLEAKLEEVERQRTETAQNHSAIVAGYMVELNQRSESLQGAERELQQLSQDIRVAHQASEDFSAQLVNERHERTEVERQLAELRKVATTRTRPSTAATLTPPKETPTPALRPPTAPAAEVAETPEAELSVVRLAEDELPDKSFRAPLGHLAAVRPLTVVHLDESKELRESIRRVVARVGEVRYLNTMNGVDRSKNTDQLLAVNLINRAHDPVAAISTWVGSATRQQNIFAYCAEGTFGFSFGQVRFLTQPLKPDACIQWLSGFGSVQRLLSASSNIELMSNLRTVLTKARCSTSVALDLRQVMDLIPMTQPEAVLIDLSLPRAEGLRLISRLRSDAKTHDLPIAVLLPEPQMLAEFRQHAARAAREGSIAPDQLAAILAEQLGLGQGSDAAKSDVAQAS